MCDESHVFLIKWIILWIENEDYQRTRDPVFTNMKVKTSRTQNPETCAEVTCLSSINACLSSINAWSQMKGSCLKGRMDTNG